ncbi:DNA/RNA non-specific endonuclease [Lapidilactobacillus achengensis]|uniref:DNA/RNA non-specific endonuclease n=1 Tax=Lapidilactobacillus achengensis TaxID=2486000 RepID=A0ABW1UTU1_9LACO|nr:DNA/RNA non-specific endonuclease [Lapidilactobacillus achengensis]
MYTFTMLIAMIGMLLIPYGVITWLKRRKSQQTTKLAAVLAAAGVVLFLGGATANGQVKTAQEQQVAADKAASVSSRQVAAKTSSKAAAKAEKAAAASSRSAASSSKKAAAQSSSIKVATEKAAAEKKAAETKRKQSNTNLASLTYQGTQTINVNQGQPTFSSADLSLAEGAWEKYGELDQLNRATSAEAMLNQSIMPTGKRGSISEVTPTGWKNKKINGGYLFNRSHLIGWALAGENANWKNLITGTRQLNSPEMLRYEMDVKAYLEQSSKNYVRYSVTPIFRGNELLARGVHMMAQAVNSQAISFNVYIFNVQSGVTLNYADGSSNVGQATGSTGTTSAAGAGSTTRPSQNSGNQAASSSQTTTQNNQAQNNQNTTPTGQVVFVTPTGKRYHKYAHGNGTFTKTSLQDAKSRGLTPCQVCW